MADRSPSDEVIKKFGGTDPVPESRTWPDPLRKEAYIGIVGDIVDTIEPESEADPAALLIQTLVAFAAHVGRGPHYRVEGDQHHALLACVLVGSTSRGRKGTSWGRVRQVFSMPDFPKVTSGLSSGEGFKWHVRDPVTKMEKNKKTGIVNEVVVDSGVEDKRLIVIEAAFAQVLRQGQRSGNILSPTIRAAWDGERLASLTKNDPIVATGAHVCIIGHVTDQELAALPSCRSACKPKSRRTNESCLIS